MILQLLKLFKNKICKSNKVNCKVCQDYLRSIGYSELVIISSFCTSEITYSRVRNSKGGVLTSVRSRKKLKSGGYKKKGG